MASPLYIQGDVNPVVVPVATATALAIKDLIAIISDEAVNAAATTWDTDLATTQGDFAAAFVGVSMQQKVANVARIFGNSLDNTIVVATGGIWEFDLAASASVKIGEYYAPAKDTGNALLSQSLVKVSSETDAIGQCVEYGSSVTRVKIQLLPSLVKKSR